MKCAKLSFSISHKTHSSVIYIYNVIKGTAYKEAYGTKSPETNDTFR